MKKQKGHLIKSVDPGSIAEELELEPGRPFTYDQWKRSGRYL